MRTANLISLLLFFSMVVGCTVAPVVRPPQTPAAPATQERPKVDGTAVVVNADYQQKQAEAGWFRQFCLLNIRAMQHQLQLKQKNPLESLGIDLEWYLGRQGILANYSISRAAWYEVMFVNQVIIPQYEGYEASYLQRIIRQFFRNAGAPPDNLEPTVLRHAQYYYQKFGPLPTFARAGGKKQ